jgi:hypothetical protein
MIMFRKSFETLDETDLQDLVDQKIPEAKTIEYKLMLHSNSDSDKKEFLADVSSFANTSGGYLIYGIKEALGVPVELVGIDSSDMDKEILRLQSIIQTGVEPRMPGISIRDIRLSSGRSSIIIHVPRSWLLPHRLKQGSKFYSRNSKGKYELDVGELRALFLLSDTAAERMRTFRADRVASIISGHTFVHIEDPPTIVLHFIPLRAFEPGHLVPLEKVAGKAEPLQPMEASGWGPARYNFDGVICNGKGVKSSESYVQLFRNGILESVLTGLGYDNDKGQRMISLTYLEKVILSAVARYLSTQRLIGVEPPIFIALSLIGVEGANWVLPQSLRHHPVNDINRDLFLFSEIMLEDYGQKYYSIIRPVLDMLWNAAGFESSFNYNDNGEWAALP